MSFELRLGDCLDPVTGLASLADKSVDHVICDPPYSEHVHGNAKTNKSKHPGQEQTGHDHEIDFTHLTAKTRSDVCFDLARVTRRWVLVFCDIEGAHEWRTSLEYEGLEYIRTGIWRRIGTMPQISGDRPAQAVEAIVIAHRPGKKRWNGGGKAGLWSHVIAGKQNDRLHPTEKPQSLMEALIRDFCDIGDLVLDPFAGSGTTGAACIATGRRFVGWERDPKYHAIASKRLTNTREQLGLFKEGA